MRYRGGRREGDASRLHYFSGSPPTVRQAGARRRRGAGRGIADERPLRFMTDHRSKLCGSGERRGVSVSAPWSAHSTSASGGWCPPTASPKSRIGSRPVTCSPSRREYRVWTRPMWLFASPTRAARPRAARAPVGGSGRGHEASQIRRGDPAGDGDIVARPQWALSGTDPMRPGGSTGGRWTRGVRAGSGTRTPEGDMT